jgi:hypothetical protein
MNRFLRSSSKIYRGVLCLYPRNLRRDFGEDMLEVFAESLTDAWRTRGTWGLIHAWCLALWELVPILLAGRRLDSVVIAPVASFCGCFFALGLGPGLAAAAVSALAVERCRRRWATSGAVPSDLTGE